MYYGLKAQRSHHDNANLKRQLGDLLVETYELGKVKKMLKRNRTTLLKLTVHIKKPQRNSR